MTPIYHGDNGNQEFFESQDNQLLITRNHEDDFWFAFQTDAEGGYVFQTTTATAEEAAQAIGGKIDRQQRWMDRNLLPENTCGT